MQITCEKDRCILCDEIDDVMQVLSHNIYAYDFQWFPAQGHKPLQKAHFDKDGTDALMGPLHTFGSLVCAIVWWQKLVETC